MTKQDLQQYLRYAQEYERLRERIATVQNEIEGIRSLIVSDMPSGGKKDNEKLERLIDEKTELIQHYTEEIQQGHIILTEIETALGRLTNQRYKTLLSLRYLDGRTWAYIAEHMNVDERYVYKLHGWALQEFEKNFKQIFKMT